MKLSQPIPFNIPYLTGHEEIRLKQALDDRKLHGDGDFTNICQQWFVKALNADRAFLTSSCTLGLEMATLVAGLGPGDEVLVPDFTFVSTAQCVALRGAKPVLCDIRKDTLNIDETRLNEAISPDTRAIIPVHYAGVSAEMNAIRNFAKEHNLLVIEDAAQAIGCYYDKKPAGSFGDMAVFSFHSTKNVHCGEGGMVVVNNPEFSEHCEIAWEKGTDRRSFLEGHVEKYQWQALGSSFLASEITAAILSVQLEFAEEINRRRLSIWETYSSAFRPWERKGLVQLPTIPENVSHNGHMFYMILPSTELRSALIKVLKQRNITAVFHYTPLHESNGGREHCRPGMDLPVSSDLPHRLLRLPLYPDLSPDEQARVIEAINDFFEKCCA